VVILTGEVDWQYQKATAEGDIRRLGGVIAAINNVVVKPSVEPQDIREKIKRALERTVDTEAAAIGITVDGGRVTLSGDVHSWSERTAAERAAWSAPGVTQVTDHLSIRG
jgi:osmotically-inducible protein OsmY